MSWRVVVAAVSLIVSGCSSPAPSTTLSPTAEPTVQPSPAPTPTADPTATTGSGAAVHPPACGDAVLEFDGKRLVLATCISQVNGQASEQLWALDDSGWTMLSEDGPPPVVVTGAAWDPERNVLVRYGGLPMDSNACTPDTWEWDGAGWTLPPALDDPDPPACDHMKLVYDPTSERVLMVGGGDADGNLTQETWAWDGRDWSPVAEGGPDGRAHHSLVWDEGHSQVLLYGGYDGTNVLEDFWTWDGDGWNELAIPGPGPRSHHGMAMSNEAELMLFGGATGPRSFETLAADTWILTDGGWHELDVEGPSARLSPALGFDKARALWMLYGGFDASGNELADTWQFDGSTWHCVDGCEV